MAKSRESGEKWWNVVKSRENMVKSCEKLEKVGEMGKSGEKW